jgi:hypothetical protein
MSWDASGVETRERQSVPHIGVSDLIGMRGAIRSLRESAPARNSMIGAAATLRVRS